MNKPGTPEIRAACAKFARHHRARYRAGLVAGPFTYHEWTRQVAEATANKLALMVRESKRAASDLEWARMRDSGEVYTRRESKTQAVERRMADAQAWRAT